MSGASEKPGVLNGFEETVKDFWVSRPRRPHAGRKVAGVAAAIGYRYGIDPVVVRIALVVTTIFGGFGIPFYLLGWLFLPGESDEVSGFESLIGRGRSSVSPAFAVVLMVLTVVSAGGSITGSWFDGGGLISCALITAALYLLHRSRGHLNRPAPVAARTSYPAFTGNGAFTMTDTAEAPTPARGWDPLAADPAGWDLPDATPPVHEPTPSPSYQAPERRPRSKVGSATFALAVVTAGAGVLAGLNGAGWFDAQHIIGLVLGVVGIGLVAGAFARGGRGLIGLAIPLAIAGLVLTTSPFKNFDIRGGVGDIRETPQAAAELKPLYQHAAGDIRLDLTELPEGAPYSTTVSNGAGDTTVLVPANADVTFDCHTGAGEARCFNRSTDGISQGALTGTDNGPDGVGGQKITLKVSNSVGNVEVRRD
ncbi:MULTISPECIES: PspC domain-containing protein [unclassified Amycolatopsis]|uniref:PspC domain-containing protein n=1 Tax=unclassified Amycolatopsis TaxID=2618356 RepID=UPI0028769E6B|nr:MULTISPECIES: PspC domain-containing protein [unclassified Amycolatopsis]MDS0132301.1 PspC domain-containing protein [Amycolatopsis sp. 505]MDS0142875.1 PspC domain-containing protein [Amycolatopsis sp. CM201R]